MYYGQDTDAIYTDEIFRIISQPIYTTLKYELFTENFNKLLEEIRYVNGTRVKLNLNSKEGLKYIKQLQKQYHVKFYYPIEELSKKTYIIFTTGHKPQDSYTCIAGTLYFPNVPAELIKRVNNVYTIDTI